MRLIDADELFDDIETINFADYNNYSDVFDFIDNAPTIEADPVRHGEWFGTVCSACGESTSFYYDCTFCPSCGAKMDGGDSDETIRNKK